MNRIQPLSPAQNYKTFQVTAPAATHRRKASCEEYGCERGEHGWLTRIDENTDLGQKQAYYIRKQSGRKFTEYKENGLTSFVFNSGQDCFDAHTVPVDRPELYLVKGGDWRGNPAGVQTRQHTKPEFWIEEFQENQTAIIDAQQQG